MEENLVMNHDSSASGITDVMAMTSNSVGGSVLNCVPSWWGYTTYGGSAISSNDMEIRFIENGFILKHLGKEYAATSLNNLFKQMEKLIEEKIENSKGKKK